MEVDVVTCECEGWKTSWPLIEDAQVYYFQGTGETYKGQIFRFCPWCSKELQKIRTTVDLDEENCSD